MTAKAEGLSPALTGKFSLNDARNGRRENNFGATITTVQSAACNSVVLAPQELLRPAGLSLTGEGRLTEQPKMWVHLFKNPHNFFQNQHFKNDDSIHELLLKSELKSMRLSSILTRTKMSKFAILNQNGSSISTPSVSSR